MKRYFVTSLVILLTSLLHAAAFSGESPASQLAPEALEEAAAKARSEHKHMLVAFLGTGWSIRCKRFKEQVLNAPAFKEFAGENLVYFPVEARRRPKLTSDETAVLQSWVIHFDIKAYPTLIILAPDGQELLRHGYRDIRAGEYIDLLKQIVPANPMRIP